MNALEQFDYGLWHCSVLQFGDPPLFHPYYRLARKGSWNNRRLRRDGFATIEECRAFLCKEADEYVARVAKSREEGAATKAKRREARIAKVTREYLLGKHIGNLLECAICSRALSDQVSTERGIGSECWPNLMDRLAKQAPECEARIVEIEAALLEIEGQTFEKWLEQRHYDSIRSKDDVIYRRSMSRIFIEKQEDMISMFRRDLADQQLLLAAARKWNEKLLTPAEAA
jgi:hypothetical protein